MSTREKDLAVWSAVNWVWISLQNSCSKKLLLFQKSAITLALYIINPWNMFLYGSQSFICLVLAPSENLEHLKVHCHELFYFRFFSRFIGLLLIMRIASYWICLNFSNKFLTPGWPQVSTTLVVNEKTIYQDCFTLNCVTLVSGVGKLILCVIVDRWYCWQWW